MTMKETLLRFVSKFDDKGQCKKCEISWEHRDTMPDISFTRTKSAFPLCQQCYEESSVQEVSQHFKQMWLDEWEKDVDEDAWETFEENVREDKEGST